MWVAGLAAAFATAGIPAATASRVTERGSASPYRVGLARLVSPALGVVALEPSGGGLAVPPRVLVTSSAGRRFTAIGPQLPPQRLIDDVFFLDRSHGWVSVWNTGNVGVTVYRTRDGGRHWQSTHVTHHTASAGAVATIQFLDPRTGWLVNEQPTAPNASLYATTDGGAHWHLINSELPEIAPVVFSSEHTAWQGGGLFGRRLERSRDGGRTWARMHLPTPAGERSAHAVVGIPATFGRETLAPVTYLHHGRVDLAVYRSPNGGDTWALTSLHRAGASTAAEGCRIFAGLPAPLAVSLTSPSNWWVGVYRAGAWYVDRTDNAGSSWRTHLIAHTKPVAYCPPLPDLQALDQHTAWFAFIAGRRGELFTTADGGEHWRQLQP